MTTSAKQWSKANNQSGDKMRKIEKDMLKAIENGQNKVLGNTYVNPVIGGIQVWLHGNHIATVDHSDGGSVTVNKETLRKYPTNTTKSRLRALGVDVRTVKGVTMLDGVPV